MLWRNTLDTRAAGGKYFPIYGSRLFVLVLPLYKTAGFVVCGISACLFSNAVYNRILARRTPGMGRVECLPMVSSCFYTGVYFNYLEAYA